MAKLKIVKHGDETLRKVCRPVEKITPRIITLLDDMIDTMRHANGCGLAAVQVGVLRRVVVIETEEGLFEFINPKIIAMSGVQKSEEGCLSVPGRQGYTDRPMHVKVEALNRNGEEYVLEGTELLARAICHETDHLDGRLYIDVAEYMYAPEDEEEERVSPRLRKYARRK